jgi:methylphosphotriester-DNA--protein-cysteine methyltransferase
VKLVAGRVAVSDDGKTFHVPGCPYLRDKAKLVTMETAVKSGFAPCIRCEPALLPGGPGHGME